MGLYRYHGFNNIPGAYRQREVIAGRSSWILSSYSEYSLPNWYASRELSPGARTDRRQWRVSDCGQNGLSKRVRTKPGAKAQIFNRAMVALNCPFLSFYFLWKSPLLTRHFEPKGDTTLNIAYKFRPARAFNLR